MSATVARRVGDGLTDVVLLLAVVVCIPLVILAVGLPIAGIVQLILWAVRQF